MLCAIGMLGGIDGVLVLVRGIALDWPAYATVTAIGGAIGALGLIYRGTGRSERLAGLLLATACFVLFTMLASAFTYLLLPIWRAPIDPVLAQIDAMLGFHWPDALTLAAQYPTLSEAMRFAYLSSLPQFALLILVLGLSGRQYELHVFMLATTLTCLVTIAVWALFPSFGTSTMFEIAASVEAELRPVVGSAYGAQLKRIAFEGPVAISPRDALGLIAAPSYHTVMALLAMYAARTIWWLWPGVVAVNLLVLPGIVVHGGHHLVDVIAGAAVTALGIAAARFFLRTTPRRVAALAVTMRAHQN